MDSPLSPPVLYLEDDDDDNETNMSQFRASSSIDMNTSGKKRKLTNTNVRINPSIVNWSKRQRNNHYQQQSSENFIDSDPDPDPIILDPDEYIIEEPDSHSFRSFDWTIESRPPPPPAPAPVLPTKISSKPVQTPLRVSTMPISNVKHIVKRPMDKPDTISVTNSNDKCVQQQRKPIAIPAARPSLALSSLPLPQPTSSLIRSNLQRGRPVKNSRVSYTQSTSPPLSIRQRPEQPILTQTSRPPSSSIPTVTTNSTINNTTSEIRRQILNGTGIFSAFHDSKYYRCNICKFKSVTSSTLLQHLFTHMFFCDQCSFYTYSHYNLSQHLFDKHSLNLNENLNTNDSSNPKSFDLLYITRCSDGTFALCMDSSPPPSSSSSSNIPINKTPNNDKRLIISSAILNDQYKNKISKKKNSKQKQQLNIEEDNDIVLLSEKHDINHQTLIRSKIKDKSNQTYVLMKHRRLYSIKKSTYLHSLTSEYNICREHTIRHICNTQDILKRRKYLTKFHKIRLIDDVANCLRIIVNQIIDSEENSDQPSLICTLPNSILGSILSIDDLNTLTNLLKLNNKYEQYKEQNELYKSENNLRQNREYVYILSSPETNHNEQLIISSLNSSMTNGDSIFTQTKINKLPTTNNNTYRYLQENFNTQSPLNNSNVKVKKNINTTRSKPVTLRPIIQKPSRPLPTTPDKNNNSISKISTTTTTNFIVLD